LVDHFYGFWWCWWCFKWWYLWVFIWFINYLYGLCDLMDDFFMDVDGDV
jgi:hypothetical protein